MILNSADVLFFIVQSFLNSQCDLLPLLAPLDQARDGPLLTRSRFAAYHDRNNT